MMNANFPMVVGEPFWLKRIKIICASKHSIIILVLFTEIYKFLKR